MPYIIDRNDISSKYYSKKLRSKPPLHSTKSKEIGLLPLREGISLESNVIPWKYRIIWPLSKKISNKKKSISLALKTKASRYSINFFHREGFCNAREVKGGFLLGILLPQFIDFYIKEPIMEWFSCFHTWIFHLIHRPSSMKFRLKINLLKTFSNLRKNISIFYN